MLVDTVEVELKAGRGGDGIVSWRHEKFVPKGGPDGGDGGNGGSVYLCATHDVDTLSSFRYRKVFKAEDGERGMNKKMYGAKGKDLELLVPVGTIVTDLSTGEILFDINEDGQRVRIAKGGKGGQGNVHFATATHQRPQESTPGQPGQSCKVRLELRLVADVALIGEPNAGKSSILKALTGAEVRIGDYAFSTVQPALGVAKLGTHCVTLVDLPGLLQGAHQGKGLGDKFLQHVTRVKSLLHVVDATADIKESEKTITTELTEYDQSLGSIPRKVVINKIDLLTKSELTTLKKRFPKAIFISTLTGQGLDQIRDYLIRIA